MKILTVVVIVFALLMLPNHIVFLWFDFGDGSKLISAYSLYHFLVLKCPPSHNAVLANIFLTFSPTTVHRSYSLVSPFSFPHSRFLFLVYCTRSFSIPCLHLPPPFPPAFPTPLRAPLVISSFHILCFLPLFPPPSRF